MRCPSVPLAPAAVLALVLALVVAGLMAVPAAASSRPAGPAGAPAVAAPAGGCADVHVVFARGTGERPGLGVVGTSFVRELRTRLPGLSVAAHAVDYRADGTWAAAVAGGAALRRHAEQVAAACPAARLVVGGYSLGAAAVGVAAGVRAEVTGAEPVTAQEARRVAAVVAFGSPLGALGQTLSTAVPGIGGRSRDYCGTGDRVCAGRGAPVPGGHTSYASRGATALGAAFAADLVRTAAP